MYMMESATQPQPLRTSVAEVLKECFTKENEFALADLYRTVLAEVEKPLFKISEDSNIPEIIETQIEAVEKTSEIEKIEQPQTDVMSNVSSLLNLCLTPSIKMFVINYTLNHLRYLNDKKA